MDAILKKVPDADTPTPRALAWGDRRVQPSSGHEMQEFSMAFTPLHRALGLEPSSLVFSMLQSAVDQHVTEREDLDWKEKLPDSRQPKAPDEFAKDVAAMVNSGGGMIVFGMAENRTTSAAERIMPIEGWTDATERKLRGWAYSYIQPPVHGLEFTAIADGDSQAVVLLIPPSYETPHFVMKDDVIRAPRRYGARTVFMSERDIEQAYRVRFEDRRNSERSLADLIDQTLLGLDRHARVWLAAAARPKNPRPAYAGRIPRPMAQEILSDLMSRNPFMRERQGMETVGLNARPGYRKWRATYPDSGTPRSVVDIHDDGCISLAYEAWPIDHEEDFLQTSDVHVMDAQSLPAHIVHLTRSVAARLDMVGDYEVCLTMSPPTSEAIYIRTFDVSGRLSNRERLAPIPKFQPISGLFAATGPADEALEVVRNLALDVMNHGGVGTLGSLYLKDQI